MITTEEIKKTLEEKDVLQKARMKEAEKLLDVKIRSDWRKGHKLDIPYNCHPDDEEEMDHLLAQYAQALQVLVHYHYDERKSRGCIIISAFPIPPQKDF